MTLFDILHFERPWWLFFIPMTLLLAMLFDSKRAQQKQLNQLVDDHLLPYLQESSPQPSINKWLGVICLSLCWIGLTGISWQQSPHKMYISTQKTIFVVDQSLSMYATDIKPNRQTQLKQTVRDILEYSQGGDMALVAYAGDSYVISPFSQDKETIIHFLLALEPIIMPVYGNRLSQAIETALTLNKPTSPLHLIVLTDDLADRDKNDIPDLLDDQNVRLDLIAFGTDKGGPIKLPNGRILKKAGQTIIPSTPLAALEDFTNDLGGHFYHGRLKQLDLQQINQIQPQQSQNKQADNKSIVWQDQGHWFALPFLVWLAYQFRRGVLFLLLIGILSSPSKPLHASPLDWFKTSDQQAQQAVDQGDWQTAEKLFKRPDWQAASSYALEKYDQTIKLLEQTNRNAADNYNLGNAYALAGQTDKAIQSYEKALEQDPKLTAAKENLDYLKQQQKDHQPQQKTKAPSPKNDQHQGQDKQEKSSDGEESTPPNNSNDTKKSNKTNETQDKDKSPKDNEQSETDNNQSAQANSQQSMESKQALEQWLRQIQDDPGTLLQRKLEYLHQEKRNQNLLLQEDGINPW
ncbi:VWA domain-containing protein [Marinomonas posidonica]|uniref:Tetratricopeptide TPR_1 repeat-containing protein n=1 Tax=Marinomonas posidonica (strain CECT 7376 / NCIMB 14433 / IVIA-Po-181) TaxID=491952 RepID=F6CTK3_MARPP|nr:VWA domain-containing protein [Marinomonas posidonica]AEF55118.1 Tetratricopeptide TPR_1 repeat-containing protein [Marinomonas posidonica IVIA-Po-181]